MNTGVLNKQDNKKIAKWYTIFNFLLKVSYHKIDFMNLGYHTEIQSEKQLLDASDKTNDLRERQILIYLILLKEFKPNFNFVLEVGSGLGGGAYVINKYLKPKKYIGIDINRHSVRKSNSKFDNTERIRFYNAGYADFINLNYQYDAVICLEASLHFENIELFFTNVYSSLEKDGEFYYGDVFSSNNISTIESTLKDIGYKIISKNDIRSHVIKSIELLPPPNRFQKFLHHTFLDNGNLSFSRESKIFKMLDSGELTYILYKLAK